MKKTGLKYGQYAGLGLIIMTLLLYLVNAKFMLTSGSWLGLLVLLVFMVMSCRELRMEQGNVMSLSEGFKVSWITWAISTIMSGIFSLILIYLIDPSLLQLTQEIAMEATEKLMNWFGASEDAIQEALEQAENSIENVSLSKVVTQFLTQTALSLLIGAFISLIIGAFMKRKPQNTDFV
jgi:hypothetical protein